MILRREYNDLKLALRVPWSPADRSVGRLAIESKKHVMKNPTDEDRLSECLNVCLPACAGVMERFH